MIKIRWREELKGITSEIGVRDLVRIAVSDIGGTRIRAYGFHPTFSPHINRTVAVMTEVPPEEVEHYKQVLADLIQVKYGVTNVKVEAL